MCCDAQGVVSGNLLGYTFPLRANSLYFKNNYKCSIIYTYLQTWASSSEIGWLESRKRMKTIIHHVIHCHTSSPKGKRNTSQPGDRWAGSIALAIGRVQPRGPTVLTGLSPLRNRSVVPAPQFTVHSKRCSWHFTSMNTHQNTLLSPGNAILRHSQAPSM